MLIDNVDRMQNLGSAVPDTDTFPYIQRIASAEWMSAATKISHDH